MFPFFCSPCVLPSVFIKIVELYRNKASALVALQWREIQPPRLVRPRFWSQGPVRATGNSSGCESVCFGTPSYCPRWPRNGRVHPLVSVCVWAARSARSGVSGEPFSFRGGRGSVNCCALSRSPQPSRIVGDFHRLPAGSGPKRVSRALASGSVRRPSFGESPSI